VGAGAHRVLYYWHSVGNNFLTMFSNMATNLNLTDMEVCYKVFRRDLIQKIKIEEDRLEDIRPCLGGKRGASLGAH
jgi:hypothetical protein